MPDPMSAGGWQGVRRAGLAGMRTRRSGVASIPNKVAALPHNPS